MLRPAYVYGSYGYPAYTKLAQLVPNDPSSFSTALSITLRECVTRIRFFGLVWGTNMACASISENFRLWFNGTPNLRL